DLSGVNPLTDTLVVGNGLDQKIDAIVAKLAAEGTTIAQVTASIAQNPTAPAVVARVFAPSAADCKWLKSGKYRVISRDESDPKFRFELVEFDAKALNVKSADGNTYSFTSDGSCQFQLTKLNPNDDTVKLIVSSGGVILIDDEEPNGRRHLQIALPEQALPIAELAGTKNFAAWVPANIPIAGRAAAVNVEVTLDSTGQITASKTCVGLFACLVDSPPFGKLIPNVDGGFDVLDAGGSVVGRSFVYKTPDGSQLGVNLRSDNTLAIAVPKNPLSLPAVGTTTKFRSVEFDANAIESISALTEDTVTVTATDSNAKTVTRMRASDNRVDTLTYDKPRDGLRYRAGNSCTINNASVNCSETVQIRLQGIGITLSLSAAPKPALQFYQFSIDEPQP
ncbi:MAG TPA: hypothetical protein PLE54_11070, partial [Burkholderiaceae bacterium]|nr:hypothetical protein [Burkholderiaceae bacterium]